MSVRRVHVAPRALALGLLAIASGCAGRGGPSPARDEAPLAVVRRLLPASTAIVRGGALPHALPSRADETTQLRSALDDASLEIAPEALVGVEAERDGDALVFREAARDTDVVILADATRVEELRVLRSPRASTTARWRIHASGVIAGLRLDAARGVLEAVDRDGRARFATTPMFAIDAHGTRRALASALEGGTTLVVSLDVRGLAYPIVVDPQWTATTGALQVGRVGHGAALLPDGTVLVAGGYTHLSGQAEVVELFDPKTSSFTTTAPLPVADIGELVPTIGGRFLYGSGSTSACFDAATKTWTPTDFTQATHRTDDARVRLPDGRVMSVTGYLDPGPTNAGAIAEIYDPKSNTWSKVASLTHAREGATASLLASGKVLVAGGIGVSPDDPRTSAELWDPATDTWTEVGPMLYPHFAHGAVTLPGGGKVLVVGGDSNIGSLVAEIFDEATRRWIDAPGMANPRARIRPLVVGGRVLVVGGRSVSAATSLAEWFDPATMRWSPAASMTTPRESYSATTLADGRVLVAGGAIGDNQDGLTTAEIFDPQLLATGVACTAGSSCTSGVCAQGICCASACVGACQSCAVPGHLGTCVLDPACGSLDAGTDASTDAGQAAPVVGGDFRSCAHASDCASGHCVDGVCCDTPCAEACHSCALPGSPGVCTPEPVGVDLRHECGGGLQCSGTCGPGGACVGSGAGAQCAASRCTSATAGVGPALCAASGAACPTDTVAPFDCSPYVCEPAFGACRASCASSAECANGFLCDTDSKTCVAPPAPASSGGCALGVEAPVTSAPSMLLALVALLALAARRGGAR